MANLKKLANLMGERAKAQAGHPVTLECPECGDVGPHDTNGDRVEPTFCCAACGTHTDVEVEVTQKSDDYYLGLEG